MPLVAALLATAATLATPPLASRIISTDTFTTDSTARAVTPAAAAPAVRVSVDSARQEIVITAGPFKLEDMTHMASMGGHAGHHGDSHMAAHHTTPLMRFQWPVEGWMRGFRVDMRDASGKALPSSLLHHLIGVNLDRRQLVYPAVERLFGWGSETAPVELPKSMGVPLTAGDHLGMYAMFDNQTGHDIEAAYLRVTLLYTPKKGNNPLSVLPLYVDVNNVIGGVTTFDVPPGKSTHSYTFEVPVGVRVIAVGGHLHDYGSEVRLEDAESGKVLVSLKAKRDDKGHVESVGRFIFGFGPDALHLEPQHRYRVVAEYVNPTRDTVKAGGMGHINGAIVPDDMSKWPVLDPNDPLVKKDVTTLPGGGGM